MIGWLFKRSPWLTTIQLFLLLTTMYCFVVGLGGIVRGAETSAFMPVAILAVLLGWGLSQNRLKGWQAFGSLGLLGSILLWGRTARLGAPVLELAAYMPGYLVQNYFHKQGGPLPDVTAMRATVEIMAVQSVAVWGRVQNWLTGLTTGTNQNDPVVRILAWSVLLWMLAAWAGWASGRNKVLGGLVPALGVLAASIKYTGANVNALWLMAASTLALLGIARFDANLRRWAAARLDYAEVVVTNTMFAMGALSLGLAMQGWALPMISVKDFLETMRKHDSAESQTARSLGLEVAREPVAHPTSQFAPLRASNLPNKHLLGSGPELSKDVVFTVKTGELSPIPLSSLGNVAPRHYWRSYTFDNYTGLGWISTSVQPIEYPAEQALFEIPPGYRLLTQNFNLRGGDKGSLYWTGNLYRSDTPFEAAWRTPPGQKTPQAVDPFRGADLLGALNAAPVYQVESLIPQVSIEKLRAAGRDYPDFIQQRYTTLPPTIPERVYALARDLTSAAATPFDEAKALETYLRQNYPYSLDVPMPPHGVDVADYFLFNLKTGYCDYYATAMAVMARSVGIPARLVMGYANGSYNYPTAEYIVTAADAHSWVEIYFPGTGWVEFEPTAGQPELIRPTQGSEAPAQKLNPVQQWDKFLRAVYRMPSITREVFLALAGLLGLILLFFLLESWLLNQVSPTAALRWMVRAIYRQGARLTGAPVPGQTASEFTEKLQNAFIEPDPRLNLLTGLYLQGLFSPQPPQKVEIRQAIKAWRGLRWKLLWVKKSKK